MTEVVFIGDEVSAAGYRLAGARTFVPAHGEEGAVLASVRTNAELVLIAAQSASQVPPAELAVALAAMTPLVLVVPDVRGIAQPPDLGKLVRKQLGMEA